jgi:hypothetical protein
MPSEIKEKEPNLVHENNYNAREGRISMLLDRRDSRQN